jgi:hypothetical protein
MESPAPQGSDTTEALSIRVEKEASESICNNKRALDLLREMTGTFPHDTGN